MFLRCLDSICVKCTWENEHTVKHEQTTTYEKQPPAYTTTYWIPNLNLYNIELPLNNDHLSTTATNSWVPRVAVVVKFDCRCSYFFRPYLSPCQVKFNQLPVLNQGNSYGKHNEVHRFRSRLLDDYFSVNFNHLRSKYNILRQLGQ
jgi:hypothetical protein